MTRVLASPSRVFGDCPAGLAVGDEIVIDGTVVRAVKGPLCYVAMSAFTDQVTQIQRRERVTSHLSCPGCSFGSDQENRVVFVLGSEDAWGLSQKFSAYNWGRLDGRATSTSASFCDLSWKLTQAGNYAEAGRAIENALKHLQPDSQPVAIHERIFSRRNQRYAIAIPESYREGQATPLVVALHYGGTVTSFYGAGILAGLIEPALRELEVIIVAPDCQHGNWTNPQSEAEIIELLDCLQRNYSIDARKTLITGYSLGGAGTWYIAARHQDKFAAAIPMAAHPQPDSADIEWEIPLYVIHSRMDEIVPFEETARVVKRLKDKGASVEFVLLDDITHFETERFVATLRAAVHWIRKAWANERS